MNASTINTCAAAIGAALSILLGAFLGAYRHGKVVRKLLIELVVPIAIAHSAADDSSSLRATLVWGMVGFGWSQVLQLSRRLLTILVERRCHSLSAARRSQQLAASKQLRDYTPAFQRPSLLMVTILNVSGLTNLRPAIIAICEKHRTHLAFPAPHRWTVFNGWLRARASPLICVAAIGTIVNAIAASSPHASLVQASFILLLFLWMPDPLIDPRRPEASDAVVELCHIWCLFWGSLFALYVLFWSQSLSPTELDFGPLRIQSTSRFPVWTILRNVVSNINTLMLVVGYLILDAFVDWRKLFFGHRHYTTVSTTGPFCVGLGVVLLIAVVESAYHYRQPTMRLGPYDREAFGWISGFAAGVVLAMTVGRLQSKYIDPPLWIVIILYVYAVIQGTIAAFSSNHGLQAAMLLIAFPMKCLLFIFVAWILESGLLLFYVEQVHTGDSERRKQRREFFNEP
jgi:hypothetical protein